MARLRWPPDSATPMAAIPWRTLSQTSGFRGSSSLLRKVCKGIANRELQSNVGSTGQRHQSSSWKHCKSLS